MERKNRKASAEEESFRSWTLSTPYDITTATYDKTFDVQDDLQDISLFATGWVIQGGRFIMLPYYGYAAYNIRFGSGLDLTGTNLDNAAFTGKSPHYNYATVNSQTRGSFLK